MIGTKFYKYNIDKELYKECALWCNNTQKGIIEDKGNYYEVIPMSQLTEKELLQHEKRELELWLSSHDYVGTKIATGRATIEEYKNIIDEMKIKAERINEIEELLKTI